MEAINKGDFILYPKNTRLTIHGVNSLLNQDKYIPLRSFKVVDIYEETYYPKTQPDKRIVLKFGKVLHDKYYNDVVDIINKTSFNL